MSRLMIVEVPSYSCEFKGIREICEIVLCGECKHTDGNPPIADGRSWCEKHNSFMYYCSDGERSRR